MEIAMRKTFWGLTGLALAFVVAPSLVPLPTMTAAGLEMRIDTAEARCGDECQRRCRVSIAQGEYKNMRACIAVWGPRNDERHRQIRANRRAFGQAR